MVLPKSINRCELPQLVWQCVRRASFQRPRQVEPHRLTYADRCGTQSVVTVEPCRETKTIGFRQSYRLVERGPSCDAPREQATGSAQLRLTSSAVKVIIDKLAGR